jgi:general stress protein YciG
MTPKEIIAEHFAKIGRKGGKATSQAKADAARENAKKGGRPKKKKPTK